eukprot:CAMPEP_0202825354 /NCGR_PEP_ID=MMETSP1389-20130828/12983_1 /ASSEMBLY_ACC=CAM_ASM_000865 /TAXON_ID=302021 /ORGANISM="Rhodomonas sp., Strain CCMP768" /LENGTH=129 /DNA_ID=CAMNT_0049498569 /DNA_START=15 /DNA_END=404 /DNA_ORIENTATION=+
MSSLVLDSASADPLAMLLLCKYPATSCWGPEDEAALQQLAKLCQVAFKAASALTAAADAKKPEEKQVHVSPVSDWEKPEPETRVFKRVGKGGRRKSLDSNWLTRPLVAAAAPAAQWSEESMASMLLDAL